MPNFNIIKPSVERIDEKDNLKRIELAGRVCYKSEKKITDDSALAFCERIIRSGHTSVLEHSNVIVNIPRKSLSMFGELMQWYEDYTHKKCMLTALPMNSEDLIVSGNVRAWHDFIKATDGGVTFADDPLLNVPGSIDLSRYRISEDDLTDEERKIHSRITLRIICDRGVSHEIVRHRVMSFSQESTRYVNYGKRGYTFIEPWWWDSQHGVIKHLMISEMRHSVNVYDAMIGEGATPQLARAVLPNQIKTEIVVTATPLQWAEFLRLRMDKAAHPDMQRIAGMIYEYLADDIPSIEEVSE